MMKEWLCVERSCASSVKTNTSWRTVRSHRKKLTRFGFATVFAGMLTITPMGRAKLIYETTRSNWFPVS